MNYREFATSLQQDWNRQKLRATKINDHKKIVGVQ